MTGTAAPVARGLSPPSTFPPPIPLAAAGTSLNNLSSWISTSRLKAWKASATFLPSPPGSILTVMTPFPSIATRVARNRVPSSGSAREDDGEDGATRERQGLLVLGECSCCACGCDCDGCFGSYWRREKKSLMSWFSRLRAPLEVKREIRPSEM